MDYCTQGRPLLQTAFELPQTLGAGMFATRSPNDNPDLGRAKRMGHHLDAGEPGIESPQQLSIIGSAHHRGTDRALRGEATLEACRGFSSATAQDRNRVGNALETSRFIFKHIEATANIFSSPADAGAQPLDPGLHLPLELFTDHDLDAAIGSPSQAETARLRNSGAGLRPQRLPCSSTSTGRE